MGAIKKYWKITVFLLVYLAGMVFLMRHDPQMPWTMAGVAGVFIFVAILTKLPGLTRWAAANARPVRLLAVALIICGPALILVGVWVSGGDKDSSWAIGLAIVLILIGSLVFTLPRMHRDQAIAQEMVTGAPAPAVQDASLLDEVRASFVFLLDNWPAFFKVAAPWLLVSLGLNIAAVQIMRLPKDADGLRPGTFGFLVAYVLVTAFAFPAVAVAWHRFVMGMELPAWGIVPPNKRFWRYFYRLWLFGFVVGTMDKIVGANMPDIARLAGPAAANTIGAALEDAVLLLAVWGAGMYALVLPAVAVDDREVNITVALRMIWPRRLQFATGFLTTVLAFYLLVTALGFLQDGFADGHDLPSVALGVISHALILGAVATSATYLSRAYMRAKAQSLVA
jgi:hypothetical protein